MNDSTHAEPDRDPAPLEHADAERATDEEAAQVPSQPTESDELEKDPAASPPES